MINRDQLKKGNRLIIEFMKWEWYNCLNRGLRRVLSELNFEEGPEKYFTNKDLLNILIEERRFTELIYHYYIGYIDNIGQFYRISKMIKTEEELREVLKVLCDYPNK
jgi:hypothetical protein